MERQIPFIGKQQQGKAENKKYSTRRQHCQDATTCFVSSLFPSLEAASSTASLSLGTSASSMSSEEVSAKGETGIAGSLGWVDKSVWWCWRLGRDARCQPNDRHTAVRARFRLQRNIPLAIPAKLFSGLAFITAPSVRSLSMNYRHPFCKQELSCIALFLSDC